MVFVGMSGGWMPSADGWLRARPCPFLGLGGLSRVEEEHPMARSLDLDELVEHFTLYPDELDLL